jgi:hypothetical protein
MNQNTWHFDQLKKELENRSRSETDRIELINPETNKKLDQKLWNNFWLPIKRTVDDSRFCVMEATLKDGKPEIRNKWDILPCRSFEIMLDNPSNPPHPANYYRNWIARIKVDSKTDHYYMELEYFLIFPADYDYPRIFELMSNPAFQGIPPELSYSDGGPISEDSLTLKFTFGSGASWFRQANEDLSNIAVRRIDSLLSLLETSEMFAEDIHDKKNFQHLHNDLIRLSGVWDIS